MIKFIEFTGMNNISNFSNISLIKYLMIIITFKLTTNRVVGIIKQYISQFNRKKLFFIIKYSILHRLIII